MRIPSGLALVCVALCSAVACESNTAPNVQSEPARAPQAETVEAPLAPSPPARVDLAKSPAEKHLAESPAAEGAHAETPPAARALDGQGAGAALPPAATSGSKNGALTAESVPRQGGVVTEEAFSTWLEASAPIVAGAPSHVEVVLVAKAPYHCNAEYPHKFTLKAAPAGLSYPEEVVRGMQVNAERSTLRIPIQAKTAGPATVSGTLSFSVCTEERCLVEKRELSLDLEVR